MGKYNVEIAEVALSLLDNHLRFLANVSVNAAYKLNKDIFAKIDTLEDNPLQYPVWQTHLELPREYRRAVVNKQFLIVYFIDGSKVFVDYIFNGSMDNSRFVKHIE